ncbi:uncharacterized protein akna [Leuresthes tenuis]|uniref:uncharacterized protein akna n=1 Tax=Leuresthes tenuis TaxID=355514 RepID=UPI003B5137E8
MRYFLPGRESAWRGCTANILHESHWERCVLGSEVEAKQGAGVNMTNDFSGSCDGFLLDLFTVPCLNPFSHHSSSSRGIRSPVLICLPTLISQFPLHAPFISFQWTGDSLPPGQVASPSQGQHGDKPNDRAVAPSLSELGCLILGMYTDDHCLFTISEAHPLRREGGCKVKRNTTVGVSDLDCTSRITMFEDSWDDDDEEEDKRDDDFASQMDENGIIGLSEALEDVELGENYGDAQCPGSFTPEQADPGECVRDNPSEELNSDLSEHPDHTESAGEEALPSIYGKNLGMTEEEKDGEEEGKTTDRNRKKHQLTDPSGHFGFRNALAKGCNSKGQNKQISSVRSASVHRSGVEPAVVSRQHCPVSQSWPHLFHFTAEELATAPGIDAETFPEMDFTESLPEAHCTYTSPKSSPRCPEMQLRASPQPAASFSEKATLDHFSRLSHVPEEGSEKSDKHHKPPVPQPRKTKQCLSKAIYSSTNSLSTDRKDSSKSQRQNKSCDREPRAPRARCNAAEDEESRKGSLNHHTPDFSKVEPRVHFPKDGYKPPKSRHSLRGKSLSPEPPLVFKSPADIVKEVLLNNTDETPTPSDCSRPHTGAANSAVPLDFRCRQQATTLLEQLQEDHNRLLTKYAEAENTIDRLRLEARVNLYADPPMAGHAVHSGLNHNASKLLKLGFSQAQKAEIGSASPRSNGHGSHQGASDAGPSTRSSQLGHVLFSQTDKFLQQLQTFEDLLKNEKLKPREKIEGVSQLVEGLSCLERAYLLATDEHKVLRQTGAETCYFDPERELEGLIFQCGLRVDELKEPVEPSCEASPSDPSEGEEVVTRPQSPTVSSLDDAVDRAEAEVGSACKGSTEEKAEDGESLPFFYRRPLISKRRCVVRDFIVTVDHQRFKEHLKVPLSAALKTDVQHEADCEEWPGQGATDEEVRKTPLQRKAKSEPQDPAVDTSKQRSSRSGPPSYRQSTMLTVLPPHCRGSLEMGKSHSSSLSSLADLTTSERRSSKAQKGSKRALSQDGIISPETDSGFVGSESSRQTPAAVPSDVHQRASESVSVPREESRRPQPGPAAVASPPSQSVRCMGEESRAGSQISPNQPRRVRQGQRRRRPTCPPQSWISQRKPNSVTSHTGSEVEQSDQYTDSSNSLHSSHLSSSPTARYHHDDCLRALSFSPVATCSDAFHSLQAELTILRERLESYRRTGTAAPSAQRSCSANSTSTPRIRSGQQSSAVRESHSADEDEEESTLRRTTRERLASVQREKPQHVILTESGLQPSTPQPLSRVSRCTQTSAASDSCSTTVRSRRTQTRQHFVSGTADEPDSTVPLCLRSSSHVGGGAELGTSRDPPHSSPCCHRCPLSLELHRCSEPGCCKQESKHLNCQAAQSPERAGSRCFAAAASPASLPCMSVFPPQLLLYSSPVIMSPHKIPDTSSGGRDPVERAGRTRRSLSVAKQPSTDSSLDRAIRAARHMKLTSRHMARSLATGLQYQELLTQS